MVAASFELIDTAPGHGEVLSLLHEQCFEQDWSAEEFERLLALPNYAGKLFLLTIEGDQIPIGFILCQAGGGSCDVVSICVIPDHRRRGFAGALLDGFEDSAPVIGITEIYLEVAEDNLAAIAFYQSRDYFEVGRRRDYYRRGSRTCDALVFQHTLG